MKHKFSAKIYKTGINWAVDVPEEISSLLIVDRGYIRITGTINRFKFTTTLLPVKNSLYRLFVNGIMMKGGNTAVGETAIFIIENNKVKKDDEYPMPEKLVNTLKHYNLLADFNALSPSRRKEINRYLGRLKSDVTFDKNLNKLIDQLRRKDEDIRIPKKDNY